MSSASSAKADAGEVSSALAGLSIAPAAQAAAANNNNDTLATPAAAVTATTTPSSLAATTATPAAVTVAAPASVAAPATAAASAASSKPPRLTLERIGEQIRDGTIKKIIVLTGAGISVSAGIPDFRTPGTGLYDNLQRYNLPHPTAVFELSYFRNNPAPFFLLAKELYPGSFRPTPTHFFIRALEERGVLLKNFTQNIDGLEYVGGLRSEKLVQAHGGFQKAACIDCQKSHEEAYVKEAVFADRIPRCTATKGCNGLVKPCITFFGEGLPAAFGRAVSADFPSCDLLVVLGTSLQVQPFASLISRVGKDVPRLLINNEKVGHVFEGADDDDDDDDDEEEILSNNPQYVALQAQLAATKVESLRKLLGDMLDTMRKRLLQASSSRGLGFGLDEGRFDFKNGRRDVFLQSDCDSGVRKLAAIIGEDFAQRVEQLVREDREAHPPAGASATATAAPIADASGLAAAMAKATIKPSADNASKGPASAPTAAATAAPAPSSSSAASSSPASSSSTTAPAAASAPAPCVYSPPFALGFDFDHTLGMDQGLEFGSLVLVAGDLGRSEEAHAQGFEKVMQASLKSFRDGHIKQIEVMKTLRKELGITREDDAEEEDKALMDCLAKFHKHCFSWSSRSIPLPGVIELLTWVKAQGIPTAIFTNGWSPLQQLKVSAALGDLAPPFVLVSDQSGAPKPSPLAFDALCALPGFATLPRERVWYIGDNPSGDCVGALRSGLNAIWLDWEGVPYPTEEATPPPTHTIHAMKQVRPIIEQWIKDTATKEIKPPADSATTAPVKAAL